ncbi:MAG: lycopene cyclase, partial [Halobacteriaceae archaeon]
MPLLPDITVAFGAYTYLVSEAVFGLIAITLCHRSGALRRGIQTVVVLYPIAFFWDWYTLRIGVFTINKQIGVDVLE